jgi:hypothetical protein
MKSYFSLLLIRYVAKFLNFIYVQVYSYSYSQPVIHEFFLLYFFLAILSIRREPERV